MFSSSDHVAKYLPTFPLGRKTIGRYELLRPLASGGMAAVFLGRLSGMAGFERLVAIKVIHPHLVEQHEFVEMFLDEARLSAKIHHPNVVEIFEVGEDNGLYFMVAELVRGRSLKDLLKAASDADERLDDRLFLTIISKVCDALHAAHTLKEPDGSSMCLVHRDISPSNILISFDGFVKLIDFGIAFAQGRITTTRSGVVKGKFGYMAPEQLTGEPVDRRIDIFSLGVVLYLLATGRHPFPGANEGEQVNRLLNDLPASPRTIVPFMEQELERTILKALAKDPAHRHQTAAKLGMEIGRVLVPKGGYVDSTDLAGLMTHFFAKEIAEDRKALERAMAMSDVPNRKFNSNEYAMGRWSDSSSYREKNRGSDKAVSAIPSSTPVSAHVTELMGLSPSHNRKPMRLRLLVFALFVTVGVSAIVMFLDVEPYNHYPMVSQRQHSDSREALQKAVNWVLTIKLPADENRKPSDTPSDSKTDEKTDEKSVEIVLKGLPESATVRLNGNDTAVVAGKIIVPSDGIERELKVIASGYHPYIRKIDPEEDGELTVELRKKRARERKSGQNKRKPQKAVSKKLMECPYCDQ